MKTSRSFNSSRVTTFHCYFARDLLTIVYKSVCGYFFIVLLCSYKEKLGQPCFFKHLETSYFFIFLKTFQLKKLSARTYSDIAMEKTCKISKNNNDNLTRGQQEKISNENIIIFGITRQIFWYISMIF